MSDGRKNNGGPRPNSGRPSRTDEVKLAATMRNIMGDESLLMAVAGIAQDPFHKDQLKALELWCGYLYGKPTQRVVTSEVQELPEIVFVDARKKRV